MTSNNSALGAAVDLLEQALESRDEQALNSAFGQLQQAMGDASPEIRAVEGPRMATALERTPLGASAFLAVMVGACVELGADAAECAGPVLAGAHDALCDATRLPELWAGTVGGELPEREPQAMDDALGRVAAAGALDAEKFSAVAAWTQLPMWEMAAVAMLSHEPIRRVVQEEGSLTEAADAAAQGEADLKCLRYLLKMFDDEPMVVLHRETGTGYRVRISGLGDNFQLHTLLAHVLIGGGHVPGEAPSPEAVAGARDVDSDERPVETGAFNLVGSDGAWIWNEGCPADIPLLDGERVLVLDPPPYERSWRAGRFFPHIAGDVVLEAVLPEGEAAAYLAKVAPAAGR